MHTLNLGLTRATLTPMLDACEGPSCDAQLNREQKFAQVGVGNEQTATPAVPGLQ